MPTEFIQPKKPEHDAVKIGAPTTEAPVRLSWKDPEDGQVLWVELWGTRELVGELLEQGFEVRTVSEDETASSLCVRILQRADDPA